MMSNENLKKGRGASWVNLWQMKIFSKDERGASWMQCWAMKFPRKGEALLGWICEQKMFSKMGMALLVCNVEQWNSQERERRFLGEFVSNKNIL